MARKPISKCRRKIEMCLINSKSDRRVSFSKRRPTIFKKANELCILTGSEIAIIVFSPTGKAFSFGYPNVDSVTERFVNKILFIRDDNNMKPFDENVHKLNEHCGRIQRALGEDENHGKVLDEVLKCMKPSINEMNFQEILEFKTHLEEFKIKFENMMVGSEDSVVSVKQVKDFDINALPNDY
ncbi:agamous-like MADS-box protein AGL62 [Impatiens glandulifera]|uniref:agamous-like MADS-box protein AGL62 n=1 Tax=Impatiens glandulifera TaxID=253017 RepID=UPI001FB18BE8|nr:agamous-like MADS-box protein AGL62 [Impatiens glandulifera]